MQHPLYCLMFEGITLDDEMRFELLYAAREMVRHGTQKLDIHAETFEGRVKTNFREALLGSTVGGIFTAEIEAETGKGRVAYLVRFADLGITDREWEELGGEWIQYRPPRHCGAYN